MAVHEMIGYNDGDWTRWFCCECSGTWDVNRKTGEIIKRNLSFWHRHVGFATEVYIEDFDIGFDDSCESE